MCCKCIRITLKQTRFHSWYLWIRERNTRTNVEDV